MIGTVLDPPSNIFFQLVLISWMVKLSSGLIWQIISFILPPNEYDCVYAWTTLGSGPAIDLQKMSILANKIIFSDEAHFNLGGYENKQICGIWGTENPYAYIKMPMHPKRVTVWCWCWTNFCLQHIWFQQDGATCHTAEATRDVLRIITRRADVVWPPQSSDLKPLDYYFWGAVKDKCYADKSKTIDALKHNIREAIDEIQLHTIDNVLKNWTDRVSYCMTSRVSHLNEIIFHY